MPINRPTIKSEFDQTNEMLRFFGRYLKKSENGVDKEARVHYFTQVEEKWKSADTWPPAGCQAASFYLGKGNGLKSVPDSAAGSIDYEVDTTAGSGDQARWNSLVNLKRMLIGYPDRHQRDSLLLTFNGAPLEQDMEITGQPVVSLFISSNATDGQVFVYLEEVDDSGAVNYITEGALLATQRMFSTGAARYDDSLPIVRNYLRRDAAPLIPGEIAELRFDLLPISYLVKKGHRLRVAIAGADRDHFAPLPGAPPEIQVHYGAANLSRIELPLMPR